MAGTTTSRSDMVRGVSERLSRVEGDRLSPPLRATRARELSRRLAETLAQVEGAIQQRRIVEQRLDAQRADGRSALGGLRASLALAQRTEREAGQALLIALQSACDALAAWSPK